MLELKVTFGDHESDDLIKFVKGRDALLAYAEIFNWIRRMSKYENKEFVALEELREFIVQNAKNHEINDWI